MFSTMTIEPSTSRPMAIARPPIDIRLAEIPRTFIARKVKAMQNGIDKATTREGLTAPRKTKRTSETSTIPSIRALVTVSMHFATRTD